MTGIHMHFMGGFQAFTDGSRLSLASRNAVSVLAILCLSRSRMSERATVASMIWDICDPEHARASLRQTLFVMRRSFGREIIRCDGESIGLDPTYVRADVWDFEDLAARGSSESLRRAADLYRGPFLRGHAPGKGFAFAEWLEGERNRLRDLALQLIGRSLDDAIAGGAMDAARRAALRMLAIDPVEESAHRALMRVYVAERRFGLALRQFELCRKTLDAELGVGPDAETRTLHAEIVRRRAFLPRALPREGAGEATEAA